MDKQSSFCSTLSLIFKGQKELLQKSVVEGRKTQYGRCCSAIIHLTSRITSMVIDRSISETIEEFQENRTRFRQFIEEEKTSQTQEMATLVEKQMLELHFLERLYSDYQDEEKKLIKFKEEISISHAEDSDLEPTRLQEACNSPSSQNRKAIKKYLESLNAFWVGHLGKPLEKVPKNNVKELNREFILMEIEESLKRFFWLSLESVELLVSSLLKTARLQTKYPDIVPAILEASFLKSVSTSEKFSSRKEELKLAKATKGYNDAWIKIISSENSYFEKTHRIMPAVQPTLNYHLWCLKTVKSDAQVTEMLCSAEEILTKYEKRLEPHPLYKLHMDVVTQETLPKSQENEKTLSGPTKQINKVWKKAKQACLECNSPLTAVISSKGLLTNDNSMIDVRGVSTSTLPIMRYLRLSSDQFDSKGDMSWSARSPQKATRGGFDYFLPVGWKGYGISCLGKYDNGNDNWLTNRDKSGWAIAFIGVGTSPMGTAAAINNIITSQFNLGPRQIYEDDIDVNPLRSADRKVGKGIYFAREISIPAQHYSKVVEVDGKKCRILLQCRLKPSEIRIPSKNTDYYVVPNGTHVRPYRILMKDEEGRCSMF